MDEDLKRAAEGNSEAMARIVREHYSLVFRFCARRVGAELAQDAAQETFLTAHKSIRRFDGRSAFSTWLLGIAHNHCRNLSRKHGHEAAWLDGIDKAMDSGERSLIDRHALREALAKLSPEHREAVLLHEIEGLTYDEAVKRLKD